MEDLIKLQLELQKILPEYRFYHSLGVSYTASCLAMRYGVDSSKAQLAGLLHDCAKYLTDSEILAQCRLHQLPVSEMEEKTPHLLHGKLGAWYAKEKYEVTDSDVGSAIRSHSTGRAGMSLLEQIIFVADYMEIGRKYLEGLEEIRSIAFCDLDKATYLILLATLEHLKKKPSIIDPTTILAFEYYEDLLEKRKEYKMDQSLEMVKLACAALEEHKGEDIRVIEIGDITTIADYFVIANGTNSPQVQALVDAVEENLGKNSYLPKRIEGAGTSSWILMDYGDIIVHVFSKEDRLFYDLERIWRDGKSVPAKEIF